MSYALAAINPVHRSAQTYKLRPDSGVLHDKEEGRREMGNIGRPMQQRHGEQAVMHDRTRMNKTPLLLTHKRIPIRRLGTLEAAASMLL